MKYKYCSNTTLGRMSSNGTFNRLRYAHSMLSNRITTNKQRHKKTKNVQCDLGVTEKVSSIRLFGWGLTPLSAQIGYIIISLKMFISDR